MHQVMLLIEGKWVPTTWQLYNRYKHEGQMGDTTAAMVLKTLEPFETRLNEPVYKINYLTVPGLDMGPRRFGGVDLGLTYKAMSHV